MNSLDFDKLGTAKIYNKARSFPPETWKMWRKVLLTSVPKKEISLMVDLGCGTGRFLNFLEKTFSCKIIAIDPSKKMLAEARKKIKNNHKIKLIQAPAEQIPLKDNSVDMVFISLAFHTFNNPNKAVAEVKRILKPGGYAVIRQPTKETNRLDQGLKLLPESLRLSKILVITRKQMFAVWKKQGFIKFKHHIVKQKVTKTCREFYERVSLRGASIYKLIPDKIFNKRLDKLKHYCGSLKREHPIYEMRELFVFKKPKL